MTRGEWQATWARLRDPNAPGQPCPERLPIPTAARLDLLKAALLPAEDATPAWRRWKSRGLQLQTTDADSIRMFSQLWENRAAAGLNAEDLPVLKGYRRMVMTANALTLKSALDSLDVLVDAGIPVVVFKGAALVGITGRLGLRRIQDLDVLVPFEHADRAIALLKSTGHTSKFATPTVVGVHHAWDCRSPSSAPLDVHWSILKSAGDDRCVFETARQVTLLGRPVLIPSATECLAVAIGNGFGPGGAPLRWILDAMTLLDSGSEQIDWDELVQRSRRPGLTLPLADGLDFLRRELGASVPDAVITELAQRRIPRRESAAHRVLATDPTAYSSIRVLLERDRASRLHHPDVEPRDPLGRMALLVCATGRRRGLVRSFAGRAVRSAVRALPSATPPQRTG